MKRILVLDDDIDILNLVKTILTMNGFFPEVIADWQLLWSTVNKNTPDLILIDISLSGASGIDLCRQMREKETLRHIPVILFSANVEMAKRASECGASDYLPKPFSIKELVDIIKKHT